MAECWIRWSLWGRAQRDDVLKRLCRHNFIHPIEHGARVVLPRLDRDQRRLFEDWFLLLFLAPWAARLDASKVEWLQQEIFPDPPEGQRRILDLVAKLPTREAVPGQRGGESETWLALVHIEIESGDKATPLRSQLFRAYAHLRDRYRLPVLPIGVFLKVGLDGIGVDVYEEHFWEFRPIRFEYLYVGLPALDAIEYVQGPNWLGVALAALMKIPKEKIAWLGAEALRRILEAPLTEQQRFLLGECVQAYLPLEEEQQREYERLVTGEPYKGVQAMNVTWYEKGLMKGREEGRLESRRETLREQLEERFGPLSDAVCQRIQELPADRLAPVLKALVKAESLDDLGLED